MNDRQLLKQFVRVEVKEKTVQILVCEIRWDGPSTPISTWEIAKSLPATADAPAIKRAAAALLRDHRYFQVCLECGERNPVGWMLNEGICHSCAETNHGVVF